MTAMVTCNSCQRSFAFKSEFAGKRVKCKCGGRIEFPVAPISRSGSTVDSLEVIAESSYSQPSKNPSTHSALMDWHEEPAEPASMSCAHCRTTLPHGSILCTSCGYNHKTRTVMKTQVQKVPAPVKAASTTHADTDDGDGNSGMKNMIIGGLFCLVGLGITIGTYNAASADGGCYVIAYGPVIFGGLQFLRGVGQMMSGD